MNFIAFFIYCVIVTVTPGPTNIAILSIAHNCSIKKTFQFVLGVTAAMGTLLTASVVLNSVLVAIVPKIIPIMQIIGSLYMLYLAYKVLKMNILEDAIMQTASFMSGFLMQFINPKAWLFIMTVIPGYVMPYYKSPGILFLFVLVITGIAFSSLATWAIFGTVFKRFLQRYQRIVNITLSVLLVYSAIEVSGIFEIIKG